jgi:hypothetical protein
MLRTYPFRPRLASLAPLLIRLRVFPRDAESFARRKRYRLRHPDPWKLGGPADAPSPALKGTLSPSDGERDGVRGRTSIPRSTPIQTCGSGDQRLGCPRVPSRDNPPKPHVPSCRKPASQGSAKPRCDGREQRAWQTNTANQSRCVGACLRFGQPFCRSMDPALWQITHPPFRIGNVIGPYAQGVHKGCTRE